MDNYHTRAKESGSLVTFLVVGLVLAALVIGGVYTVQKRSSKQPSPSPVASAPAEKKPTPSASPKPSTSSSASPHATPSQKPKASPLPSPAAPSKSPAPSIPKGGAPLPATGPSEDFMLSTLMFAGLVSVSVAYMRSRNALRFAKQVD